VCVDVGRQRLPGWALPAVLVPNSSQPLVDKTRVVKVVPSTVNVNGSVTLYADSVTDSMKRAMDETNRRRLLQADYNKKHGITPQTVVRSLGTPLVEVYEADYLTVPLAAEQGEGYDRGEDPRLLERLRKQMKQAAASLEFEKAAELRDRIRRIEERELGLKDPLLARGAEG